MVPPSFELMACSQRERWSFDSEHLRSSRRKNLVVVVAAESPSPLPFSQSLLFLPVAMFTTHYWGEVRSCLSRMHYWGENCYKNNKEGLKDGGRLKQRQSSTEATEGKALSPSRSFLKWHFASS
ncbi:hypothetical protein Bca4012_038808 [Brassica carinata]